VSARGTRSPNRGGATNRLRRLLAMVPWLAANDGPTVAEVCARFDITAAELQADLELLTYYVGIPPYTPDAFFEITIERGRVFARVTPSLDRPLRLTPAEGLSLVAAGRVLADDPEGPLATGLAKVAGLLQIDPEEAIDIDLGLADESVLAVLRDAVAGAQPVEIDHYAEDRDERLVRIVDPWLVTSTSGRWYVVGHDHLRDAERSFRIDRIVAARPVAGTARPMPAGLQFAPGPADDAPRVVLELEAAGSWVAETYPVDGIEDLGDGRRRVTLAVNARPWLERLLLRLGPAGRVVDGPADLVAAGREGARRTLARYS
jgi:proteasome accessory factor C